MTGTLVDEITVETEAGEYTISVRFTDWDRPEHRDTHGLAVARYSIRVKNPEGESESFVGWGSVAEAEEQELMHTSALDWGENVLRDGLMFYEEADGTHADLGNLTASAIRDDLAPMIDRLAHEFGIEAPSEAVRVFGGVMDTANRLHGIGADYHELRELYEAVRERIESDE